MTGFYMNEVNEWKLGTFSVSPTVARYQVTYGLVLVHRPGVGDHPNLYDYNCTPVCRIIQNLSWVIHFKFHTMTEHRPRVKCLCIFVMENKWFVPLLLLDLTLKKNNSLILLLFPPPGCWDPMIPTGFRSCFDILRTKPFRRTNQVLTWRL